MNGWKTEEVVHNFIKGRVKHKSKTFEEEPGYGAYSNMFGESAPYMQDWLEKRIRSVLPLCKSEAKNNNIFTSNAKSNVLALENINKFVELITKEIQK